MLRDDVGICGVMAGRELLAKAIRPTGIERLDLLPAGEATGNAGQILQSRGFAAILAKATPQYDRIVIDSAAANEVVDARLLAGQCDGALVVLRHGTTRREEARQCCNNLRNSGGNIVGVVVNDVPEGCSGNFGTELAVAWSGPTARPAEAETAAADAQESGQEAAL